MRTLVRSFFSTLIDNLSSMGSLCHSERAEEFLHSPHALRRRNSTLGIKWSGGALQIFRRWLPVISVPPLGQMLRFAIREAAMIEKNPGSCALFFKLEPVTGNSRRSNEEATLGRAVALDSSNLIGPVSSELKVTQNEETPLPFGSGVLASIPRGGRK